jgi:hypothetical protein
VQLYDEEMNLVASREVPGRALAAWTEAGDVWLAWQDAGQINARRFDQTFAPRDVNMTVQASDSTLSDIAAYGESLFLLTLNPTRLIQMIADASAQEVASYPAAQTGRLLVWGEEVVVVLQTTADASLWLERYAPLASQ